MRSKLLKTSMISIATAVVLSMTGCGGGGGSSSSSSSSTSGSASDGYIQNATVCVDFNNDGKCNDGNSANTDENGYYSLILTAEQSAKLSKNTPVIVIGGKDQDTGLEFNGTLQTHFSVGNITPLTTLVEGAVLNGDDLDTAKQNVANALGLNPNDVTADPVKIAQEKPEVLAAAMTIHRVVLAMASAAGDNDVTNLYKTVAKVVAKGEVEKGAGISGILKAAAPDLPDAAAKIAKSNVADNIEGLIKQAIESKNKGEDINFSKVAKDTATTYVKNVAEAAKTGKDIDSNVSTLVQQTVQDTIAKNKPSIKFANKFVITKNDGTNYNSSLSNTLDTSTFATVNIDKNDGDDITEFNITLADANITKDFNDTKANLSFVVKDLDAEDKNLTISIPDIIIKDQNTSKNEINITIPANTKITFIQNGVKIVDVDDGQPYEKQTDTNITFSSKDGNLTIELSKLVGSDALNLSDEAKDNLNSYFAKVASYNLALSISDINNSNIYLPFTKVEGQVNVNKVVLDLGNKISFTRNDGEVYSTTITDGSFDNTVDVNVTNDTNLSDFNITLSGINISKDFNDINTSLTFEIDDVNKTDNTISLKIPTVIIKDEDTDDNEINVTIPENTKLTFKQTGDINITSTDNVVKSIGDEPLVFKGRDSNLTISLDELIDKLQLTDEEKDNLNNYLRNNRTYKVSITMGEVNDSKLIIPDKQIAGKVKVTVEE